MEMEQQQQKQDQLEVKQQEIQPEKVVQQQKVVEEKEEKNQSQAQKIFSEEDDTSNIIQPKQNIVIIDNRKESRLINLQKDRILMWRKQKIDLRQLIGKPFERVYEVEKGKFKEMENGINIFYNIDEKEDLDEQMEQEGKDNRDIIADRTNFEHQSMSAQEIESLKNESDMSKHDLIKQIADSNQQLDKRTAFSKQKYLNRKKRRHLFLIIVKKATLETTLQTIYAWKPKEIGFLRQDSLAYFLYNCSIVKDSSILMFDYTRGLAVAGAALRLNGEGNIDLCHGGILNGNQKKNATLYLNSLNIPHNITKIVELLPSTSFLTSNKQYSHLLIAGDFDALEIVEQCEHKLIIGGQFCAYSPHSENLKPVYDYLAKQGYVFLQLTDTFMRTHQVLSERTHPVVETSSFSGYVLRGIKVANSY